MATDGPDPPPCARDIMERGEAVFITHSIPSNAMERWVRSIAERSFQRVDWHFVGGRAVVLAIGDLDLVREAIETLMPEHNRLRQAAKEELRRSMENRQ